MQNLEFINLKRVTFTQPIIITPSFDLGNNNRLRYSGAKNTAYNLLKLHLPKLLQEQKNS